MEYPYPMVRLIVPFLTGIIAGLYLPSEYFSDWILLLLLFLFIVFVSLALFSRNYQNVKVFGGFTALIFIAAFGLFRTISCIEINNKSHFSRSLDADVYVGRVIEEPVIKKRTLKAVVVIEKKIKSDTVYNCSGKALVYFEQDSASGQLNYGDVLVFSKSPARIEKAPNPGAFDFKRYMEGRNVFHQLYVKTGDWKIIERDQGNVLIAKALDIRKYLIGIFVKHGVSGTEKAVASALILGADDEIDPETMNDYAGSGVLHILSVSGMHVGIIYLIIAFSLKILLPGKRSRYIKIILPILLIWFYSLISGLSPSVLRAATMFSFLLIAELFSRKIPPENSLAASAFVLLMINPLMLMNVGFQLSFIAVAGIMFIYKRLNEYWQPENIIVQYLWQLVAVSLAAQLVTAPISVYYFHQFPLYFMLANLMAIPLSTIAMYSGVALLVFSNVPIVSDAIAYVFNTFVTWLNLSVKFIDDLPYAVFRNITVDIPGLLLLYAVLIFSLIYLTNRKRFYLNALLSAGFMLAAVIAINYIRSSNQRLIVISHAKDNTVVSLINGRSSVILTRLEDETDNLWHERAISGLNDHYHVKESEEISFDEIRNRSVNTGYAEIISSGFIAFSNCRFALIDNSFKLPSGKEKFKCNFILLRNNTKVRIDSIMNHFETKLIIADGSNKNYLKKKWNSYCEQNGISFYDTRKKGAFVYRTN